MRARSGFLLAASVLFSTSILGASLSAAQSPKLVKDINSFFPGSNPDNLTRVGTNTYFTADDQIHGTELFILSDDSSDPRLVKDINAQGSSAPSNLFNFNGTLFFSATEGTARGVWRSDGSEQGTTFIANGSFNYPVVYKGKLFYFSGSSLYQTDGTNAGTVAVPKSSDPTLSIASPRQLLSTSQKLFIVDYNSPQNSYRLYSSEGTAESLTLLATSATSINALALGDKLLFSSSANASIGNELWASDGTVAGTQVIKDIFSGSASSFPERFTVSNGRAIFTAMNAEAGREVWSSDGTAVGTTLLLDSVPGTAAPGLLSILKGAQFTYIVAGNSVTSTLWRTDGTVPGTAKLADLPLQGAAVTEIGSTVLALVANSNESKLFAIANGTATEIAAPINCAAAPRLLTAGAKALYLAAATTEGQCDLWSVGTSRDSSTQLPVARSQTEQSNIGQMTILGSRVVFIANDGIHGAEPWISDGSMEGTYQIRDIVAGKRSPNILGFIVAAGRLYFWADDASGNFSLWSSDGTSAGTFTVISNVLFPQGLWAHPQGALFAFAEGGMASKLYFTSGTAQSNLLVKNFSEVSEEFQIDRGSSVSAGGFAYFIEEHRNVAQAVWRSDGTPAGTIPVTGTIKPENLFAAGKLAYFSGTVDAASTEKRVWRSDGTPAGTFSLASTQEFKGFDELRTLDDQFSFAWYTSSRNSRTFLSDGTDAGTTEVAPFPLYSGARLKEDLYYLGFLATEGGELWKIDKNGSISFLMPLDNRGNCTWTGGGDPIIQVGDKLYFAARDEKGCELWQSTGTKESSQRIADINLEQGDSIPRDFTTIGNQIFFIANDGKHGDELWTYAVPPTPTPTPTPAEDLCPADPNKVEPGTCGCGKAETDINSNQVVDCQESAANYVATAPKLTIRGRRVTVTMPKYAGFTYEVTLTPKTRGMKKKQRSSSTNIVTFKGVANGRWTVAYTIRPVVDGVFPTSTSRTVKLRINAK